MVAPKFYSRNAAEDSIALSRRLRAAGAVYQGQFDRAALLAALKTLL